MSGGSFDYLCWVDGEDLAAGRRDEDLASIRSYLAKRSPGEETLLDSTLARISAARIAYAAAVEKARFTADERDLLQALEWHASSDWGDDRVRSVIERMKNGRTG